MSDDKFEKMWQDVKTQRDELRLQMHLAKAELKDEWDGVEKKWDSAQDKLEELADEAGEAAKEVKVNLKVIGDELGEAYRRIKHRLDND